MNKIIPEDEHLVTITFESINYSIKNAKLNPDRVILKNLNGICYGGQVTAIMGASGAGKTSLLNILACRIGHSSTTTLEGQLFANTKPYSHQIFGNFAAYVMQNDILFETLTPKETFEFVAKLRYRSLDTQQHHVNQTIKNLKLEKCQNTMIGGHLMKGLSGGEKKRVSIGIELVTNPSCIILDEPTSGLDSFTAFYLINELRKLAHKHKKTIIFTIHQPSTDIFNMFDNILLLAQGQLIYQGKKDELLPYFNRLGHNIPKTYNPLDYLMGIMSKNEYIPPLQQAYQDQQEQLIIQHIKEVEDQPLTYKIMENSYSQQITQICSRTFKNIQRDRLLVKGRIMSAFFVGLLVGGAFYQVGNNDKSELKSLQSIMGVLFFVAMNNLMMSMFPVLLQFPIEREVFLKEENSGLYTTTAYFMGKTIIEIPFMIIAPCIQELIIYWMVGLNDRKAEFVILHLFICILLSIAGNSVGLMGGSAFKDSKLASNFTPVVTMMFMLFSGFYANRKLFRNWTGWIQYLTPLKYSFEALSYNEFDDNPYSYDPIQIYGFESSMWENIGILIAVIIVYRILAFIFLLALRSKLQ